MCWQTKHVLAGDVTTPRRVRAVAGAELRSVLTSSVDDDVVHEVLVVLSELVTNAVQAGSDTVTVALNLHRDVLELEVMDSASGWPEVQNAAATQGHGRGLAIVDALTVAWGVKSTRPGWQGKTVWAEVALRGEHSSTISCRRMV